MQNDLCTFDGTFAIQPQFEGVSEADLSLLQCYLQRCIANPMGRDWGFKLEFGNGICESYVATIVVGQHSFRGFADSGAIALLEAYITALME